MKELIDAALLIINLPFTLMLGLSLLYWLTVIIGALDIDTFDFDLDFDADMDFDADLDVDADVDADVHADGASGALSVLYPFLSFVNVGKVPFMVIFSFLILFMWMAAILANHYFNPAAGLVLAVILVFPNFLIATVLTKIITTPLVPLFKALNTDPGQIQSVIGQECIVTLSARQDRIGQAEVTTGGASLLVSVKPLNADEIKKGSKAIIVKKNDYRDFYLIEPM